MAHVATSQNRSDQADWSAQMQAFLSDLQRDTLWLALVGLLVPIVALLSATGFLRDSGRAAFSALALLALAIVALLVSRWRYLPGVIILTVGYLAGLLLLVAWCDLKFVTFLLILPVGLATLTISRMAGLVLASVCIALLLWAPPTLLPDDSALRAVTMVGVWASLGLVWLSLRPLLTAVGWAWSGYERSQALLEQARDYQLQLRQTVDDLATANVQLARLNQHANALRLLAEEERRAKEQFVANVSHELRTPLNMIIGYCALITQTPRMYGRALPPALLADLAVVLRNSQHLLDLIDDVLDLSQIEARQMALTKERVALAEIVEAAVVAVRPLFESKGLYLEADVAPDLPPVFCDRTRIREVVLNLLSNAGRFTEKGGVRLQAWRADSEVVVSVTDTGPGISDEEQARLFRPFQQLDGSVRRRYGGTGLGLSISKSFVELHGGRMWVESTPGSGATFYFRLPIDPPAPLEAGPLTRLAPDWEFTQRLRRSPAPAPPARPRLLVVETGDSLRRLLTRYLDGVEVIPVPGVEEAIMEMRNAPVQALLINSLRVAEAADRLAEAGPLPYGVPAIICSVPGAEQAAGELGVADYLVKPVSADGLLGALDRIRRRVRTVLVVDDEPDALRLFGRMLTECGRGYRVLRASDGRQALEIVRREPVDVILLDLLMPEMDGFQLLAIRNDDPTLREVPVVLVSARDPLAQPIVSHALAVTCRGGLSVHQLLRSIEALRAILAPVNPTHGRALPATPPG